MLDLKRRGRDVRCLCRGLEEWIIPTLARFNVKGERRDGRIGIWVARLRTAGRTRSRAIGVRVRRWVSFHGVALNVDPDLDHFPGIVPCGIGGTGSPALARLGITASMAEVDIALRAEFDDVFRARRLRASRITDARPFREAAARHSRGSGRGPGRVLSGTAAAELTRAEFLDEIRAAMLTKSASRTSR